MASKDTPKKYYKKSVSTDISRCRLCNSVVDRTHSKNLFRSSNLTILRNVEQIYGCALPQENFLPYLICRPCERRLNNAIQFKNTIVETQRSLQNDLRAKRCKELSPSVTKLSTKIHAAGAGPRRRSIDFDLVEPIEIPVTEVSHTLSDLFQSKSNIYIYLFNIKSERYFAIMIILRREIYYSCYS